MSMEILAAGARKLGLELSVRQLEQFESYYQELLLWNERMNLTRITGYEDAQIKHFLDSLTIIAAWPPKPDVRLVDIGTGAGLPGIPLKIVYPDAQVVLLEATVKKTVFLKHIVQKLGLAGVEVLAARAEDAAQDRRYRGRFDLVLARAVASLPALVEIALPFCVTGGRFVSQKKGNIEAEIAQSLKAARLMGGRLLEVKKIELAELPDERRLVIYEKIAPTPPQYPRRPGTPATKPIV